MTVLVHAGIQPAAAAPDAADPFDIYITDQYSYDDNLFRVPDGVLETAPLPPLGGTQVESREDYINRASLGAQVRMDASRQVFGLNLRIDDVRYSKNDYLNHRGGNGTLLWDWKLGSDWSGRINAQYNRALASFTNYRTFVKDIVETASYGGELRYAIGSRFAVFGGATFADTDHSAAVRRINKFESESARAGVEYRTPSGNLFALEHRATDAKFPIADAIPGGVPLKYDEQLPGARMVYAFTEKTRLEAKGGYLKRDYFDPRLGDFSGGVWNGTLHWEPRAKLYFDIKGWHELTAYSDAESDYFVSDGGSITPTWEPTSKITVSAEFSFEKQDYIGTLPPTDLLTLPGREDEVTATRVSIDWTPRDIVSFGIGYRWAERESNRELRSYDDDIISAQIKITL